MNSLILYSEDFPTESSTRLAINVTFEVAGLKQQRRYDTEIMLWLFRGYFGVSHIGGLELTEHQRLLFLVQKHA